MTDFDQEIFERHAENHRRMHDTEKERCALRLMRANITIRQLMSDRKPFRHILPLLKARVIAHDAHGFTLGFGPEYGSPTQIRIDCDTSRYDMRDGDLLTLYTEVLLKHAQTQ